MENLKLNAFTGSSDRNVQAERSSPNEIPEDSQPDDSKVIIYTKSVIESRITSETKNFELSGLEGPYN